MKKRIVTTTSVFPPEYPAAQAVERLAGLGFDALDLALDYCTRPDSPFLSPEYIPWAEELRRRAQAAGIAITHAHAPAVAMDDPIIGRSLEAAGAMGAQYLVLHPVWQQNDVIFEDAQEFLDCNIRGIRPWLAKAEACGVVLLSENLLWGASKDPRVIAELVRQVGSEWFGWCFDTGHANCFGYTPQILQECAAVPLSLHIQDNCGDGRDDHLIPGDGTVDWPALTHTLRSIGYAGDCVLEAHHQSLEAPDDERDAILLRLLERARPLRDALEG